ncbi:hypothetical protein [Georgenia sp. SUBG003]|uniref:phenylalanine--tRNA ligase subunit beta-related protein n=1 Tax=Georgenia sp. SUBG003 TaxID=1497974 RepID=UPI003AB38305
MAWRLETRFFAGHQLSTTSSRLTASTTTTNHTGDGAWEASPSGRTRARTSSDTAENARTMVSQFSHAKLPDVGHAGELHPKVSAALELPQRTVAFELDLDAVLAAGPAEPVQVDPVSTFPLAKEDVALVVDDSVPAADVLAAVVEGAGDLAEEVRLFDVYTGDQLGEGKKSLAFALRLRAADRTLTAEETAGVRRRIVKVAGKRVGAVLRG